MMRMATDHPLPKTDLPPVPIKELHAVLRALYGEIPPGEIDFHYDEEGSAVASWHTSLSIDRDGHDHIEDQR